MVWKGFTATVVIIAFFVLDRTMAALGHGHSHGGHHGDDEEEGSSSAETRTTRESTPDMKSSGDIKPILKGSSLPKLRLNSKVIDAEKKRTFIKDILFFCRQAKTLLSVVWALVLSLPEVSIGSYQEECFSPPIVVHICSRLCFEIMFVSELLFFSLYQQSRVQSYESLPGEDPLGGT